MNDHAPLELGWFTMCLTAPDLPAMVSFYETLGFDVVGGNAEHGYAVLGSGPIALTPMGFLADDLPNFRGGDIPALAAALEARGLETFHGEGFDPSDKEARYDSGPRAYDLSKWPVEYHTGPGGVPLPHEDAGDFMIRDPDGVVVYFDSVPVERARFRAGERVCTEKMDGDRPGEPDLGRFHVELGVADLAASAGFYARLGLRTLSEGDGLVELGTDDRIPFRIGLRAGAEGSRPVFVGADLPAVEAALAKADLRLEPDESLGEERVVRDPAGHPLCFR